MFATSEKVQIGVPPDPRSWTGTIRYADDRHLVVETSEADFARLKAGIEVRLVQLVKAGVYQLAVPVLTCNNNAFVVPVRPPLVVNCRKNARYDCSLPASYSQPATYPKNESVEGIGQTCDISMGGAQLYVEHPLIISAPCTIWIELLQGDPVEIAGDVLRCSRRKPGTMQAGETLGYSAGIRFRPLTRACQVALQRFIGQSASPLPPPPVKRPALFDQLPD